MHIALLALVAQRVPLCARLITLAATVAAILAGPHSAAAQSAPIPATTPSSGAPADTSPRPLVLVIATGGTIAGVQNQPGTLGAYRAGALTAEEVVAAVPELTRFARIETEQFSNVASPLITPAQWLALSRRINTVLATRPEIAGVVVTHGTDRLEETAFFLHLTVRSEKPVVVVGAQRPATGISPDGPINLLAAVRTAAAVEAKGKGGLVVMDDRILSAREVRKHYQRVGGFDGGEMGLLGIVSSAGPTFFLAPTRRQGAATEFDVAGIETLPEVALTFSYPGGQGPYFPTVPTGLVVATTGFTCAESLAYLRLAREGTVVVTAFPSGDNVGGVGGNPADSVSGNLRRSCAHEVQPEAWDGPWIPPLAAQHLTPQKARILLMLALATTHDRRELQRIFREY